MKKLRMIGKLITTKIERFKVHPSRCSIKDLAASGRTVLYKAVRGEEAAKQPSRTITAEILGVKYVLESIKNSFVARNS